MEQFYKDVLIKLRRKYGKDELVNSLITENSRLNNENVTLVNKLEDLYKWKDNISEFIEEEVKNKVILKTQYNSKLRKEIDSLRIGEILLAKINNFEKGIF